MWLHLDFLQGIFRLVQVLQRERHLVVQLSQAPVICLQTMLQNMQYRQTQYKVDAQAKHEGAPWETRVCEEGLHRGNSPDKGAVRRLWVGAKPSVQAESIQGDTQAKQDGAPRETGYMKRGYTGGTPVQTRGTMGTRGH